MTTPETVAVVSDASIENTQLDPTLHDRFDAWVTQQQNGNVLFAAVIPMRRIACMFVEHILDDDSMKSDAYEKLNKKHDLLVETFDDYKCEIENAKDRIQQLLSEMDSAVDDLEI